MSYRIRDGLGNIIQEWWEYDYRNEFGNVTVYVTEPNVMYPKGKVEISAPSFSGNQAQAETLIGYIRMAVTFADSVRFE
jgi:hypothetical protein